jgi:hypothetical protein
LSAGSIFLPPISLPLLFTLIYFEHKDAIATFYQIIRSHKLGNNNLRSQDHENLISKKYEHFVVLF